MHSADWAVGAALVVLFSAAPKEAPTHAAVQLGPHTLYIPVANLMDDSLVERFRSVPGMRPELNEMLITFSVEEVRARIPEMRTGRTAVYFTLSYLSEAEWERQEDPSYWADLWYRRGDYSHYVFEPLGDTTFFRAYNGQSRVLFFVLKRIPGEDYALPERLSDYWLASCSHQDGDVGRCGLNIRVDDFLLSTRLVVDDLEHLDEFTEFLRETIASWRVSPDRAE